jgi:phosphohistidine swiveling domain-containing protein
MKDDMQAIRKFMIIITCREITVGLTSHGAVVTLMLNASGS